MIRFEGVSLRYEDGAQALDKVDLSLERGTLHFLTGPSGAGKSSLLRLLYLARRPTEGRVTIFGRDVATLNRLEIALMRRSMGVVFQDFQLLPHMTVYENVALPLMVAGYREAEFRSDVLEMLEWVKLQDKLSARPDALSGGEKQRVAIARAMVSVPDLIIADEPTGSVDPEMAERIMTLLLEMQSLQRTILIATHDMTLVRRFDRPVLHIEGGRLTRRPDAGAAAGPDAPAFERPEGRFEAPDPRQSAADAPPVGLADAHDLPPEPGFSGDAPPKLEAWRRFADYDAAGGRP